MATFLPLVLITVAFVSRSLASFCGEDLASMMVENGTTTQREDARMMIGEFRTYIKNNVQQNATLMFEQVPPSNRVFFGRSGVDAMLDCLQEVITSAPVFSDSPLVGTIFSNVFWPTMGTPAGLSFFSEAGVNEHFKKILQLWSLYLDSPRSLSVVTKQTGGWLSEVAVAELHMSDYNWNEEDVYGGFLSWNDFFARKLTSPSVRPIVPGSNILTAPCDSRVLNITSGLQLDSNIKAKGQPYSLLRLFDNDRSLAATFNDGTLIQAFLSAKRYHRWHSPVAGVVKILRLIPGTYFEQGPHVGLDPSVQDRSQKYIAHTQTRGLIVVETEEYGLVAFFAIGMVEVSSCVFTVRQGQQIEKGSEVGYFQFGGSTSITIVQKEVFDQSLVTTDQTIRMGSAMMSMKPRIQEFLLP